MTKILRWLLGLVALIIIVAFAISNRQVVDLGLAPLPGTVDLPVYGVFLLGLVLGVLIGGAGVWLGAWGKRRDARRMRSKVWALESQLDSIKRQQQQADAEQFAARRTGTLQRVGG
jgi:uncharacterized integral membrane protein